MKEEQAVGGCLTVVGGVDTHKDLHVAAVVDQYDRVVASECFPTTRHGYRPRRSAHQALTVARQRCWRSDWVLDLDIKGFFDNIDHHLLMRALRRHTNCKWVVSGWRTHTRRD